MTIEEAAFSHVRVHEAMHTGILTTDESTPLQVVARLMAEQRVHAVAVTSPDAVRRPWGIVSALDIAAAVATGFAGTAGETASSDITTVASSERLEHAAQLMVERMVTHLIVVDPASGHPTGILSALDIAAVYGG